MNCVCKWSCVGFIFCISAVRFTATLICLFQDIVDWYMAIRNAKLTRLCIGFPHIPAADHAERLTRDFLMEGWLYKTGPNPKDAWRRRWFTLDRRRLYYFDEPMVSVG